MSRLTMRRLRDNLDAKAIGFSGLANDQHCKRRILEREYAATGDKAIETTLRKQAKMKARQRATRRHLQHFRSPINQDTDPKRKDYKTPEGFNGCTTLLGRSYASVRGEVMEAKQIGFPNVMRHPSTIDLLVVPLNGDLLTALKPIRSRMRIAFSNLSYGSQISGSFQIVMKTAEQLAKIFPKEELPSCVDPETRPDEIFALLHWHGVIADPRLSKQQIRRILKAEFPGCRRVHVAKVQPEQINKYGEITHGAQGFLEYSCLDKTEVEFDTVEQRKQAIIGHGKLGATWTKRNRCFSMGKPLTESKVEIDPARVAQLELMERLDHVKKKWNKLSFAEQFIHVWMSGYVAVISKPQTWLKHGTNISDRFVVFLNLIKNWSTNPLAKDTCFYGFMEAQLE